MPAKFPLFVLSVVTTVFMTTTAAQASASRFVDADTYFATTDLGLSLLPEGFQAVEKQLGDAFGAVCADSFCEGLVGNWAPLSLTCSVDAQAHAVGECSWSFAGSFEEIDPSTGKVSVFHENRTCDLGIQGDSATLAQFLQSASESKGYAFGLLQVKVPGRFDDKSLFDVLVACF